MACYFAAIFHKESPWFGSFISFSFKFLNTMLFVIEC